jgi:hypothetical protein
MNGVAHAFICAPIRRRLRDLNRNTTMCQTRANIFQLATAKEAAVSPVPSQAALGLPRAVSSGAKTPDLVGSRRRRLWELSDHAHCPVVGVCLPMPVVRRLIARIADMAPEMDDYELHCTAVVESKRRTALAESIQKELDLRHALAIRHSAKLKSTEALMTWWRDAVGGVDLAEALWVTLTHPRCTPDLEHKVLGHVHMLQHQVGMPCRVDQARFDELLQENAILGRHLASAQERCARLTSEQAVRLEAADTALMRTRAEVLARATEIAQLREQLQVLQSASPDLPARLSLTRDKRELTEQNQILRRQLQHSQQEALQYKARADALAEQTHAPDPVALPPGEEKPSPKLGNRAVLCVGGRAAIVPVYRQLIEHTGGRFLHHDGGEEDNPAQLDATLAAADLVICQTGCVSHNAYWRVKDHCKRTGKRCVFLDTPSRSALSKALGEVARTLESAGAPGTD